MSPIDRNILRMGLHELLEHPETPPEVVIDEAIELARQFGGEDSPAFVNGVLDAARKHLQIPARRDAEQGEARSVGERRPAGESDPTSPREPA